MAAFDKGPGYTVKDLFYYGGLFGGIILVYWVLQPYDVHPLVRLVAGLLVGIGLGWVLERAYQNASAPPRQTEDPDAPPRDG